MLGIVGGSVLSGAVSTLLGIFWLFFAFIQIFYKFGATIFFLICMYSITHTHTPLFQNLSAVLYIVCSVCFALIYFTSALVLLGPEYDVGDVRKDSKRLWLFTKNGCCCGEKNHDSTQGEQAGIQMSAQVSEQ